MFFPSGTAAKCMVIIVSIIVGEISCLTLKLNRLRGRQSRSAAGRDICSSPTSKSGACVSLIACRTFWGRNMPDLSNATCGEETSPKVCCPLEEEDEIILKSESTINKTGSAITTTPPPTKINSTDKSRRTGFSIFPENCGESGAIFTRIINGQNSALGAWPWMAAIYLVRRGVKSAECGGALITSSHVLTAAHCTVTSRRGQTFSPRQLLVRFGDLDLSSDTDGANPIDVKVQTIIKHERFSLRTFQHDIAILELEQSIQMNDGIAPICLPFAFSNDDLAERKAIAAGWGSTVYGGPGSSHLQDVQLRIWRNDLCREVFRRDVPITDANLCAGDGDKDACRGDSGGPLKIADTNGKYYVIGIVSFGKKCAEPGIPGVYTRVTTYLNWIEEKIG